MDLLLPHLSLAEKVNQLLHVRARCTRPRQTRSPAAATGSADGIAFGTRIPRRRGAWPPLCVRHACRPRRLVLLLPPCRLSRARVCLDHQVWGTLKDTDVLSKYGNTSVGAMNLAGSNSPPPPDARQPLV